MALNLYSEDLKPYTGNLKAEIVESIRDIGLFLGKKKIEVFEWDEKNIAISIVVTVDLPPRGNFENIEIKEKEHILIVLNKENYPQNCPRAYSNRKKFPEDKLSHLYVAKSGQPAAFCLIRGDNNEWFAEKTIRDFIIQLQTWLSDAANGDLVEDGEQFDPVRLDGYRGVCIYKHQELSDVVIENKSLFADEGYTLALFTETEKETKENYPSFKFDRLISTEDDFKKASLSILKIIADDKNGLHKKRLTFGIIVWSKEKFVSREFFARLPRNINDLKSFCNHVKIDIEPALKLFFSTPRLDVLPHVPFLIGIMRPKKLIGYSSEIEFFNYYLTVKADDVKDDIIINNIPVAFQKHNEPLSIAKSKEISNFKDNIGNALIFGCGALGSKVVMHFGRNGQTKMTLVDNDIVSPHNLVRNSLYAEHVGKNKSIALKEVITEFYKHDELTSLISIPLSCELMFTPTFKKLLPAYNWLFDFTAAKSVQNLLVKESFHSNLNICKGSIMDMGDIGVLFVEGVQRNPRIDDLQILFFDKYKEFEFISEFLQNENGRSKKDPLLINVGVGCNSETMVLSDEVVSLHSAMFAEVIKGEAERKNINKNGLIFLNRLNSTGGFQAQTYFFIQEPLINFKSASGNDWEIRMKNDIPEKLMSEMGKKMPSETGGVLIGQINKKTKCIHVTDVIFAPPDSEANEICFFRGVKGLPMEIDKIKHLSGQTFGYVGEWHTHPFGPNGLSGVDTRTVKRFQKEFLKLENPMPVFIVIITPYGLIPYVFE